MDGIRENDYLMLEKDNELNQLADNIASLVNNTKRQLMRTINNSTVELEYRKIYSRV